MTAKKVVKKKVVKKKATKTPVPKTPVKKVVEKKAFTPGMKRVANGSKHSSSKRAVTIAELEGLELDASVPRDVLKQGRRNYDLLRLQAMAVYITDPRGMTIVELMRDPRFKGKVTTDTMKRWCDQDGWTLKRREAVEGFKKELMEHLQARLSENLAREVQDLLKLRAQAIHHLGNVPPDKWEGVAAVFLKLNERLSEIAEMARDGLVDDVGRHVPADERMSARRAMAHDFDPRELREAAKVLTTKNLRALRARNARTEQVNARKNQVIVDDSRGRER